MAIEEGSERERERLRVEAPRPRGIVFNWLQANSVWHTGCVRNVFIIYARFVQNKCESTLIRWAKGGGALGRPNLFSQARLSV